MCDSRHHPGARFSIFLLCHLQTLVFSPGFTALWLQGGFCTSSVFKAGRRGKGRGPKAKLAESLFSEEAFPGDSSSGFHLCVSELGPQSPPHCRGAWEINLLKNSWSHHYPEKSIEGNQYFFLKEILWDQDKETSSPLPTHPHPCQLPSKNGGGGQAALSLSEGASLGQSWLTERAERSLGCLSGSPFQFIPHIACHFTAKPKLNKYFKVLSFPPVTHLLVNVLRRTRQTS